MEFAVEILCSKTLASVESKELYLEQIHRENLCCFVIVCSDELWKTYLYGFVKKVEKFYCLHKKFLNLRKLAQMKHLIILQCICSLFYWKLLKLIY